MDPKLTKNEVRFSKLIRPSIGQIVEFSPVIILCTDVFIQDTRDLIKSYLVNGAKCKVIENLENTVVVAFTSNDSWKEIVSPEYLIKRDLTDKAIQALNSLKDKLSITY